jgi:uncharacterized protein
MPIIPNSSYRPAFWLHNGHLQTVVPTLFRRVDGVFYDRVRVATPDGDFLDLDISRVGADRVVLIAHGLEGSSLRPYVLGMVRAFNGAGWDCVAWNFRGCSGEPNRRLRSYHSGASEDLEAVLAGVRGSDRYGCIGLVGFSMGGNIVLKYLGERGDRVDSRIRGAAVFSVPCDLASAALKMGERVNSLYMRRFLRMLHGKVRAKMELFPGRIDDRDYRRIRTFKEFDDRYTAPLCGFESAEDYWTRASSKPFLEAIRVPSLLVNALDDPFLPPACYPYDEARRSAFLFLETPRTGGHVGFISRGDNGEYWTESRAVGFLSGTC